MRVCAGQEREGHHRARGQHQLRAQAQVRGGGVYADLNRLLRDREYKEEHRTTLRAFFEEKQRTRPGLLEEHFLDVVDSAAEVDVLFVTGMRDAAPVAAFAHLVPHSRLVEVRVVAGEETRRARRGGRTDDGGGEAPLTMDYRPSFVFDNETAGEAEAERIEMGRDAIPRGAGVVVVDDVLASGETLCAVLRLLREAGGGADQVSVAVVAEFPAHRGRELLRRCGFGGVNVQSLLVFGGA